MKQEKIQAYLLRVNKLSGVVYKGYLAEVDNTLEAEQRYVNYDEPHGLIAVVSITDKIDVICNDEGKLKNFPINRFLVSDDGVVLDMLVGNIMCVRHNSEGEFTSIKEDDIPIIESHLIPLMPDKMVDYEEAKQYMSCSIDKKEVYSARYPKGTIVELTEPIDDKYSPKPAGSRFKVEYVDDALQLHGSWLAPASGSIAIVIEHDKFKVVS